MDRTIEMIGPHSDVKTGVWRTLRGELLLVEQITDSHLANLIPYAKRWIACYCMGEECDCETNATRNMKQWLSVFIFEKQRREMQNANV